MAEPDFTVERFVAGDGYPLLSRRYPAWGTAPSPAAPLHKTEEGHQREGEAPAEPQMHDAHEPETARQEPRPPTLRSLALPARRPRAAVVVIHGIQSHAGWYGHSCERLSEAGFEVFFLDRRGSGMNQRERGDAPGFRCLIDDIAEFIRYRPERGLPVFLVAISWGGKLAVALQRRHPGLVTGLALVCPGFFPRVSLSLRQRLRLFRCRLFEPTRLFPVPLDDPALFTANPRWQQFLRDDPLSLHQATARFLLESARLDMYLRICPRHVTAPVLLLLAGRDRIIHNAPTRRFFRRFAARDKRIIAYSEAHHTLEFEPDPEVFISDLTSWLGEVTDLRRSLAGSR